MFKLRNSGIRFIFLLTTGAVLTASDMALSQSGTDLASKEKALLEREKELERREKELAAKLAKIQPSGGITSTMIDVLPNAKPGQCFAKVLVPAEYKTTAEKVVVKEPSQKIDIIPAKYKVVNERVVVKEATEKVVEVPAQYEKVKEKVLVNPAQKIWRKGLSRKSSSAPVGWINAALASGIPGDAPIGKCYEEFYKPAKYDTVVEKAIRREGATRIEISPAQYTWEEKKVLVKEASERIVDVPAVYETKTENILERAAYSTWKKGRGPIERINNSTGEIMCLVEIPAKYRAVTKKVLKSPATTKTISIPAEYKTLRVRKMISPVKEKVVEIPTEYQTIKKRVKISGEVVGWRSENTVGDGDPTGKKICRAEIKPRFKTITKEVVKAKATTKKISVPAVYKVVKVRKIVTPARKKVTEIPAKYQNVTKRLKVTDEKLEWRSVLCETNTSKGLVTQIQRALKNSGFHPGPIDGVIGRQTQNAIDAFQKKKGFERGGLTLRTLSALGINISR